ncbi:MAG TPA: MotA/TolQ/ExbB proton channel family protein [Bacteroidales bacterium]|jgi:biopolymer transport protein ExbB|nr:MotA/TolQ/ExbB proton channel family protein [Bacteroidales bacterium]HOF16052.1 MotA/TolQ/ExbB proton channel family protein [Bacteroidales bacterium]HON20682.1 MotA/TolQ/ExbB proton channel family protein [Bacteroidales bacterium]HOR82017.1 MotA/TolQ/ExbB proton channel family protein [Bacteroidales bacterium]HPJ91293.1 MotA/TolQ/ExbB proton channel family protein [Bacteroidales bacterium]
MLQLVLLQTEAIAQNTVEAVENVVPHTEKLNLWSLLFARGTIEITIPLLIFMGIIIYIFIERFLTLKNAMKDDSNFMNNIRDFILNDRLDSAISLCRNTNTPLSRMIEKGLTRLGKPLNDISEAINNVGQLEVARLEKGLGLVATLSSLSPMLGFLGTVTGMIVAFHSMANSGNNLEIADLAGGIYTALITTASGLVVGIFGYLFYNILVARVSRVVVLLEAKATEFMDLLHEPVK